MSMTNKELLRRAAMGINYAPMSQQPEHRQAHAGMSLALHVAAGLLSEDVHLSEVSASILDAWSKGEFEEIAERMRLMRPFIQRHIELAQLPPEGRDGS